MIQIIDKPWKYLMGFGIRKILQKYNLVYHCGQGVRYLTADCGVLGVQTWNACHHAMMTGCPVLTSQFAQSWP
jgi:hypothetical protein